MSFCCPIHGFYAPQSGVTLAICPTCSPAPPVVHAFGPATAREVDRLQERIRVLEEALAAQKVMTGDALDREAAMKAKLIEASRDGTLV